MTDEANLRQVQQIGMKESFDGGLFGRGINTTCEKRIINFFIAEIVTIEHRQERREPTFGYICFGQAFPGYCHWL